MTFIEERIAYYQGLLANIDAQILALTSNTVQDYELDTGQSRTRVNKQKLEELYATQASVEQKLNDLMNDASGSGGIVVIPQC